MSERDDTNVELVSRRVRGLLSKTTENGATEEEAMLAAVKARELMDRYRLSMSDIEVQAEPLDQVMILRGSDYRVIAVDYCMRGIGQYCGVKLWFTPKIIEGEKFRFLTFFGLRSDVEMAQYLYEMLASVIDSDASRYKGKKQSFKVGMAHRINERLIQMARDLEPTAKTASGTALVVVRGAVVNDAFAKLGLHFGKTSSGPKANDYNAYAAGKEAGNRVNLNRPVGSRGADKLLR